MKKLLLLCFFISSLSCFAQESKVLLNEDFSSNNRNWFVLSDTTRNLNVENGVYYCENRKDISYSITKPAFFDQLGEYTITLKTKHISGIKNKGFGLVFGAQNSKTEFAFVIASTSHYQIYKRVNGNFTEIVKWTSTDAIFWADGVANTLSIIKQGKNWKFFINWQFVYSMPAQPFFGEMFGITLAGNQTVSFDDLNISKLVEKTTPPVRTQVKDTLLVKEDFSNNTRLWPENSNDWGTSIVKKGRYSVEHKSENNHFLFPSAPVYLNDLHDYSITLNIILNVEDGGSRGYGLCFGFKDDKNFYAFYLSTDGWAGIYRMQLGVVEFYMGPMRIEAVKKEKKAVTNLTLKKEDKSWKFYINDQLVSFMPAQSFYGDKFGVFAGGKEEIEFDDFEVKQTRVTKYYKTKVCLVQNGVLTDVDAEENSSEISALIDGKNQTFRKQSLPDFPGYAAKQSWFMNNESIQVQGFHFKKAEMYKPVTCSELKKAGEYKNTALYIEKNANLDSSVTIYIPVNINCEWQAYKIDCPGIELDAPTSIPVGDTLAISAEAGDVKISKYNWTVSAGKIIKGQGTSAIQVSTIGLTDKSSIEVGLEINPRSPGCINKLSQKILVGSRPTQQQNGRPQRSRG